METNKVLLNKILDTQNELITQNKELAKKQLEVALKFSDYQNKQELRFSKVENYLKSDSETNTEGAIEKLNRIDNKLTILEKDIVKRSATFGAGFAGLVFVIKWIVGKIMI